MTEYEEKEVNAIANMLIEQLDRETVDKFIEDENGNLARIETYSLYEVGKSLYQKGCRVLHGDGKPRILAHKILSDETLLGTKKTDLIEYIRVLEHNWAATEEHNDQQYINFKELLAEEKKKARKILAEMLRENITAAIDSNMRAIDECNKKYPKGDNDIALEFRATCNGKKLACQGILDYIDELVGSGDNNG